MMAPATDGPRAPRAVPAWADFAVAGYSVVFAVWLAFFSRGDPAPRNLFSGLFFVPPGAAVAWVTWRTSRIPTHDAATRRGWRLIALSHLVYWAGGAAWSALLIIAPSLGITEWADSLSLPAYPLVLWGVLSFPGTFGGGSPRLRFLLDLAVVLVGAGLASWYFGYWPTLSTPYATQAQFYLAVATPGLDLAILLMTGASYLRASHPTTRIALGWLFASQATSTAGDAYYGLLRITQGYHPGHWVDAFWFASWILAWIAARVVQERVARGTSPAETGLTRNPRAGGQPHVFVLSAQALLLWVLRDRLTTAIGFAAIGTTVITVLIVLRQLVELRENDRLFMRERGQEARFRSLVQQGSDVLLVVDGEGTILFRSPSAERLFGQGPAGAAPESVDAVFERSDGDSPGALTARLLQDGPARPVPVHFRKSDGTLVHLQFLATDLREDPAVRGLVLTGRDVSERKALQDELLHGQKMRAIGQMAGGFAHDFNNILTALRGHVDLLLGDLPPGTPARECADDIAHAADRAAAITRQLLQFSRREVHRPATLDLNAVIAGLEPMLRRLLPGTVELRVECAAGPVPAFVDRSQMEQVVLNLVVNARDAMAQGGLLFVRTFSRRVSPTASGGIPEPRVVVLEVQDTGIGMDEATMARIFEPFFTTKAKGQGTGLGLATVQGNVTGAGGRLQVRSAPGAGTTFTVVLPHSEAPAESFSVAPVRTTGEGAGARVLVVDDEEGVRRVTARMLERKGYRVRQASDGEEALEMLSVPGGEADLVLTDLMMRGMGGAELITRLSDRLPTLPIVCMSGHAADEASRRQAASGAVTFLPKPFTSNELFQVLAEALARRLRPPG